MLPLRATTASGPLNIISSRPVSSARTTNRGRRPTPQRAARTRSTASDYFTFSEDTPQDTEQHQHADEDDGQQQQEGQGTLNISVQGDNTTSQGAAKRARLLQHSFSPQRTQPATTSDGRDYPSPSPTQRSWSDGGDHVRSPAPTQEAEGRSNSGRSSSSNSSTSSYVAETQRGTTRAGILTSAPFNDVQQRQHQQQQQQDQANGRHAHALLRGLLHDDGTGNNITTTNGPRQRAADNGLGPSPLRKRSCLRRDLSPPPTQQAQTTDEDQRRLSPASTQDASEEEGEYVSTTINRQQHLAAQRTTDAQQEEETKDEADGTPANTQEPNGQQTQEGIEQWMDQEDDSDVPVFTSHEQPAESHLTSREQKTNRRRNRSRRGAKNKNKTIGRQGLCHKTAAEGEC